MKFFITLLIIALIGIGIFYFFFREVPEEVEIIEEEIVLDTDKVEEILQEEVEDLSPVIGVSAGGNEILAYHYGEGETELLFVGGIHGGYSWNTVLVARELMNYLEENPNVVPENVRVTIVPLLNPDGLEKVVGTTGEFSKANVQTDTTPGRFNANEVDLNRNFDCDWQATGKWQNKNVSGGSSVFSEPETRAIRDYVEANNPRAVVVYYSAAGGVFASNCHNGILPETKTIMNLYSEASSYKKYDSFDFYEVTGDMPNWLAKENIPAISVILSKHGDIEWQKNKAGVEALLEHYSTDN